MERARTVLSKFIAALVMFMMLFSNCGFTIYALAESGEFEVIKKGFFQRDEIKYKAYFEDENGKKLDSINANVGDKAKLVVEVTPQVTGYLRDGMLRAVPVDEGTLNFKFTGVRDDLDLSQSVVEISTKKPVEEKVTEEVEAVDEVVEEVTEEKNVDESKSEEKVEEKKVEENTTDDSEVMEVKSKTNFADFVKAVDNKTSDNTVSNKTENVIDNSVETSNETTEELTVEVEEPVEEIEEFDQEVIDRYSQFEKFVDEEAIIEEKKQVVEEEITYLYLDNDIKLESDNEVSLTNIVENTRIEIDIEFNKEDVLDVNSLLKEFKLQLSGTFIDRELQEVKIGKEEKLSIGWSYTSDIEIESEYTKISPFTILEISGTILENKIVLNRNIKDEVYLPLEESTIEIEVPEINGQKPVSVDVTANKLLATLGMDVGQVEFSRNSFTYDKETGIITIKLVNNQDGKAVYTSGSDEYVIIYRYDEYIDENSNIAKNVKATVVEYSSPKYNTLTKEIKSKEEVQIDVGELITYSIDTTEGTVNKSRINANYNSEEAIYETKFVNEVSAKILTSDLVDEFVIDNTNDYYLDNNRVEFEAKDIKYKSIRFNYSDLKRLLGNGGQLSIYNKEGNVVTIITEETITDSTINLDCMDGIVIKLENISNNGVLNYELVKAIGKCNYDKSAFANFRYFVSKISAEVKYSALEEPFKLQTISCKKELEESSTRANIYINRDSLSTLKSNENVELKIELNNDKENSDLFVNPIFEVVFPKYVTNVEVQSINTLYDNGLKVSDFETYSEGGYVKMRIELSGVQTMFSNSVGTNGTNVIINANIDVSDVAPAKDDQIKLYYTNEGVTNYESQTKWSISKGIPDGILRQTNGFDATIVSYQAPTGLIAVNSIKNYDGNLSEIKSVRQGNVSVEIPVNGESRIATMELMALNNTGNNCKDVVLIGRVPFKGAQDAITGNDLETNIDTKITSLIKEDPSNDSIVDIYYSTNAFATKDLDNIGNAWTTEPGDITQIKSYMIVVKGTYKASDVLRFTYDFEIPENLPYESNIQGSFGGYYKLMQEDKVVNDTTLADTVGLTTGQGPKLEVYLNSSAGNGNEVKVNRKLDYTVTVKNVGNVDATNVVVKAPIPDGTVFYAKTEASFEGNFGFVKNAEYKEHEVSLGTIPAGESKSATYSVFTNQKHHLEDFKYDEEKQSYYIEKTEHIDVVEEEIDEIENNGDHEHDHGIPVEDLKDYTENPDSVTITRVYITEVPKEYIVSQATVTTDILATELKSNEVSNELVYSYINPEIRLDFDDGTLFYGGEKKFSTIFENVSGKELSNLTVAFNCGGLFDVNNVLYNEKEVEVEKGDDDKTLIHIEHMDKGEIGEIEVNCTVRQQEEVEVQRNTYFEYLIENGDREESISIPETFLRNYIEAEDISYNIPHEIAEEDSVIVSTKVTNIGKLLIKDASITIDVDTTKFDVVDAEFDGGRKLAIISDESIVVGQLPSLDPGESTTIDVTVKSKNLPGTDDSDIEINRTIRNQYQNDIKLEPISIKVKNTQKTVEEIEQERVERLEREDEENRKNQTANDTNTDVPQNNEPVNNEDNGNNDQGQSESTNNDRPVANTQNNSSSQQSANNNSNTNSNANESVVQEVKTYELNGIVWEDENSNGIREDEEKGISGINIYLLNEAGDMLKSTTPSKEGKYRFTNVKTGKYVVAIMYNDELYKLTVYKAKDASDDRNSDVVECKSTYANATTNEIVITNENINNIDIGLIRKDTFDLSIRKCISAVTVKTGTDKKDVKEYTFNNEQIGKVEIKSKLLKDAEVQFNYNIVVENVGEIDGYVEDLVDYLPTDMEFKQELNDGWYQDEKGYIHLKNSAVQMISSGKTKEFSLVLTKHMTTENTGVILNKASIISALTSSNIKEKDDNNVATQTMMVLVSTGGNTTIIMIASVIIAAIIVISLKNKKMFIINKPSGKIKFKTKKVYR